MIKMPDHEKLYHYLFNAVTDAIEEIKFEARARQMLIEAQRTCEEMYLNEEPTNEKAITGDDPR